MKRVLGLEPNDDDLVQDLQSAEPVKRVKTGGSACVSCYKAKVRCDGNMPCARCMRLGKHCEPRYCARGRPPKQRDLVKAARSWPRDPQEYLDRFFTYMKDTLMLAVSEQTERFSSVLGAVTLLDQFEGDDPRAQIRKRVWSKIGAHIVSAISLSPQVLIDRAATSLRAWQLQHGIETWNPHEVLVNWEQWVPVHCSSLASVLHPSLTRICVMGESLRVTNEEWTKVFHSIEERDALGAAGQVIDMPWSPLAHVICPSEVYKAMNKFTREALTNSSNTGTPGIPCFQSHYETVCVCLDRNFKPIMCYVDLRHFCMCYGAITLQRIECIPLPKSEYVATPDVPTKPGMFASLKSTLTNFLWGKPVGSQQPQQPQQPHSSPSPSITTTVQSASARSAPMEELTDQDINDVLSLMNGVDQEQLLGNLLC